MPQPGPGPRVGGEFGRTGDRQRPQHRLGGGAEIGHRRRRIGLVLDQQRGVLIDDDPPQAFVRLGIGLPDPQRRGVQQFDGGRPGLQQSRQRTRCAAEGVEDQQPGHRVFEQRDGAHHHGRDERQGALAADHQVRQDVDRAGVIEQRVQPVAHGVLHRELLLDHPQRRPGSPAPGPAAATTLRSRAGSSERSRSSASAAPVSMTVPLGSTRTSESRVL